MLIVCYFVKWIGGMYGEFLIVDFVINVGGNEFVYVLFYYGWEEMDGNE